MVDMTLSDQVQSSAYHIPSLRDLDQSLRNGTIYPFHQIWLIFNLWRFGIGFHHLWLGLVLTLHLIWVLFHVFVFLYHLLIIVFHPLFHCQSVHSSHLLWLIQVTFHSILYYLHFCFHHLYPSKLRTFSPQF